MLDRGLGAEGFVRCVWFLGAVLLQLVLPLSHSDLYVTESLPYCYVF
jgi:hypothetical protein